jgi:hypothetical protein
MSAELGFESVTDQPDIVFVVVGADMVDPIFFFSR